MKNKLTLLLLSAALTAGVSCKKDTTNEAETKDAVEAADTGAEAQNYTVDTQNSIINWTGSKPTGKHTGTIKLHEGQFYVSNDSVTGGAFAIDMKSITVTDLQPGDGKEDLENHLKGISDEEKQDHFFNTTKYPNGKFEITKVGTENGKTIVEGNLTLKDVTKNIKFPAVITVANNTVSLESEPFKINRVLWNVNYSSKSVFDNLGNQYIDDDIELKVSVKANKG